jgi:diacylglycerol kinase family enzyme
MPALSKLSRHGVPWIAIAAALRTGDRWARRAAWRGLGSVAAASVAASLAAKAMAARGYACRAPPGLRGTRPAWFTTVPSADAAAAAGFATGVALEKPGFAAPAVITAAAAAASQVITGKQRVPEVLTGAAIGAATGAVTLRWWPRRPPIPAAAIRPPRQAPAAPSGKGLALVVNASAGTTSPRLLKRLRAELPDAAIIDTDANQDLSRQLRVAAENAQILGVAGGDGTISAAAGVALDTGLPLLVIPAGTFNHFAADLGVYSAGDALAALRAGQAVLVDVGLAGRRSFVNTSSTGVYVDLVRAREELEETLGRRLAVIIALAAVLRRSRPHELILDGHHRRLWLYFAGNCGYEPQGTAPAYRPDLSDGYLDIRIVEAGFLARCRLIGAVLTGTLGHSRVYHAWRSRSVHLTSAHGTAIWLSVDGEVATAEADVTQGKRPRGLLVYRSAGTLSKGSHG